METAFFYKYMPIDYWYKTLRTGKFKVSKPSDFNDPFDCVGVVCGQLRVKGNRQYGMLRKMEKCISNREALDESCRVFSLTDAQVKDENSEMLFWSHYANGGNGVRIKIKYTGEKSLGLIGYVKYGQELPYFDADAFDDGSRKDVIKDYVLRCVWTKGLAWAYEHEVRCVFSADVGEFVTIPLEMIQGVTFGPNVDFCNARRKAKKLVCQYGTSDFFTCLKRDKCFYAYHEEPLFSRFTLNVRIKR